MTIDEYEKGGRSLYAEFAEIVAGLLRLAISQHDDIRIQHIQHRAKDVFSLSAKLRRSAAGPHVEIEDFAKDVAGCRLVFYTNGDVHRFGNSRILHDNFEVDFARSKIHYPTNDDDGAEFFISENWVVRLTAARTALPEYRRYVDLACEVQVQTILDHAWAEMAHDTIYKPMTDVGFGSAAVEGMRRRLRKVMRDYLQPAGHEFQKIASDYARLRDGKSMFDGDALAAIRASADRNELHDALERFASYVLPNYDDLRSWAPDILDTLCDATVRAVAMPDVPQADFLGKLPGKKPEAVIGQVCDMLGSGYLRYVDPDRMFDVIVAMRIASSGAEQSTPIDNLARRFSRHDGEAWRVAGPGLQLRIVERIADMDEDALVKAAPVVTIMLREALLSTVSGETWTSEAVVLRSGSVVISDQLVAMRRDALGQLMRLHGLLADEDQLRAVRHAMTAAGGTPNNSGYSDALGVVIVNDLTEVVDFFARIAPDLQLEARRRLEVELFEIHRRYHLLPPAMRRVEDLVQGQSRLTAAISGCRAVLDRDADFARYRLLVGFDNVTTRMWENVSYDLDEDIAIRAAGIDALVRSVSAETGEQWLADLERYVEIRSEDLAMFGGLQDFIAKVAAAAPDVLLCWMTRMGDRLADWLPGMLLGLEAAGMNSTVEPLLEQWVDDGRHLSSIAWYMQAAAHFRLDLLSAITRKGLANADAQILGNVTVAAARQSEANPGSLFDEIYLPAAAALTGMKDFRWIGGLFTWKSVALLRSLSVDQARRLLPLLVELPRLGSRGEEMVAAIAERFPELAIELIGRRFSRERGERGLDYEDLPYGLHFLREPLAVVPDKVVAAARRWFDADPVLAQYRGGRLIAELFPNFEHPIQSLLGAHVDEGREGVAFVLSVLRAFEGQAFLHPILRDVVALLEPSDELLSTVEIVIGSTGVVTGEFGFAEAQQVRSALVAQWEADEREPVRVFAGRFLRSAENMIAWERRRATESVAARRIAWDGRSKASDGASPPSRGA